MTTTFPGGTFAPNPGRSSAPRMIRAAGGLELRITLRNGEQLLLALVIPLVALVALTTVSIFDLPDPRIDTVAPGVMALALMSSAFTSQAITTGFDRRYGVLHRLAAAGVGKGLLLAGKCYATCVVVVGQLILIGVVAALLGWHPRGNPLWAILLIVAGVAAFLGIALLLGGTLRAEAVLALANLIWLILVGIGGVLVPLSKAPHWLRVIGELTPSGALSQGLRTVWQQGQSPSATTLVVLAAWIVIGWAGTLRWFRWQ